MCGRTCLTLDPDQILCNCKYRRTQRGNNDNKANAEIKAELKAVKKEAEAEKEIDAADNYITPEWRAEFNCGRSYTPSYNIAPTDITPVIISADHFADDKQHDQNTSPSRVIVPMMWGMIPFWHKGDYRRHGLTTNNCRLEHMAESKLYRGPFRRGQRCAILCEGFYEWQTTKSAKPSERAAYLVHMSQPADIKIYDSSSWKTPADVKLMKLAGLFDVWQDENGDKIFSYSVITFESSKIMSWLHHRMPAILETEEQLNNWLDFKNVTDAQALATLRPATQIVHYRVANLVNNSRNKSAQCNKPIELVQTQKPAIMNKMMMSWLNVRKRREADIAKTSTTESEEDECVESINAVQSDPENPPKRARREERAQAQMNAEETLTLANSSGE